MENSTDRQGKSIISKHFSDANVVLEHQTGVILDSSKGVLVRLLLQDGVPISAEVISDDSSLYVDIGLECHEGVIEDYDGVFDLPPQVVSMLEELGYTWAADDEPVIVQEEVKQTPEETKYKEEVMRLRLGIIKAMGHIDELASNNPNITPSTINKELYKVLSETPATKH